MRRARRTKIVATLGPASNDEEMISRLFLAGVDVFRINMSHSTHEVLRERVQTIRAVEEKFARPIGILVDLQGPKLRVGTFADTAAVLKKGDEFILDGHDQPGNATRVQLPHPEILEALVPGDAILIDDGKVRLETISVIREQGIIIARTRVIIGGTVSNRKGVSLPDTTIPVSAMTDKDRADLEAAVPLGVDWIALSFVQRPEDIAEVRKVTQGRALVMAKIEKPQAVARLDEIIAASDGLMVARGDLGVEMPLEKVPGIQKRITRAARALGKPVVVATQMLESMITAPVPTRAEVSDVATAVFEGADAVMLSAESAAGQYPVEAVTTMNRIAEEVEGDINYGLIIHGQRTDPEPTTADAIAASARSMSETLQLSAIVAWTSSGSTGLRIARERPLTSVLALTPNVETARRLALAWGVHAIIAADARDVDDMVRRACEISVAEDFAKPDQRIAIVAGIPFGKPGATNTIRIARASNTAI